MRILISFIFILSFWISQSQVVNPKIWYIGYQSHLKKDTLSPDTDPQLKQLGATVVDFRSNPFSMLRNGYTLSSSYSFIFNKENEIVLYSNGSKIFNGKHRLIENGDSLCYGSDWITSPYAGSYYGEFHIMLFYMATVILPYPTDSSLFYLFSVYITKDSVKNSKLVYSVIDMKLNNGAGKVIKKEIPLISGDFTESIASCKHGNGVDWWILSREYYKKNFRLFKFSKSGITLDNEEQLSSWDLSEKNANKRNFCNRFSWNGKKFASFSYKGLELYDFDRCNGRLSNRKEFQFPINDTSENLYVCFSPNDNLLYCNQGHKIYQIEINTNKVRKIADWDLREDTIDGGTAAFYTSFGFPQLAFDGKIYYSTNETTRYLHYINKPNDTGILCDFRQRSIKLLTWQSGLPNFPNYELGAVADKCGESGITDYEIDKIEVYPNPVSEFLVVSGQKLVGISIEMYNLLGQKMSPSIEAKNQGYRLGVQTLPEGIYLLQVSDKNHNLIKTERIVIQREQ